MISKELVSRHAAFIFTSLRQSVLNFPSKYAHRILNLTDARQAQDVLARTAHEFLEELASFPEKCVNPGWLETLEGDGQPSEPSEVRPASGAEIQREQAKAKARRASKTETMRKLRAEGAPN